MRVPSCVRRRWYRAKELRKLARRIEKIAGFQHAFFATWESEGETEPTLHGYYSAIEGFQDELYDLVKRLRTKADELECI